MKPKTISALYFLDFLALFRKLIFGGRKYELSTFPHYIHNDQIVDMWITALKPMVKPKILKSYPHCCANSTKIKKLSKNAFF